jgi:hypothetical protein
MSLKAVEMQIALPRTQDAGKLQSELNNRALLMNGQANVAVQKEADKKRKTVSENEEAYLAEWKDDESGRDRDLPPTQVKDIEHHSEDQVQHPFKGHHIDYLG